MAESHRRQWRPSRIQIIAGSIGAGLLALVGLAVLVTVLTGPVVPAGTTVNGVEIGGLGRDAAVEKVRNEVAASRAPSRGSLRSADIPTDVSRR